MTSPARGCGAPPVTPMGPGSPIKFRLLYKGKPLAGQRGAFIPRGAAPKPGIDDHYERATAPRGEVTLEPTEANVFEIAAHEDEPTQGGSLDGKPYRFTKYSATLTLFVSHLCPCWGGELDRFRLAVSRTPLRAMARAVIPDTDPSHLPGHDGASPREHRRSLGRSTGSIPRRSEPRTRGEGEQAEAPGDDGRRLGDGLRVYVLGERSLAAGWVRGPPGTRRRSFS